MPKGPAVVIGAVAMVLFLGSASVLMFASLRAKPESNSGGMAFGPSSAKAGASADPLAPDPALADLAVLAFELTDQDGQRVTNSVFSGKLTVLDFMFTNCPLVCPTLSGQLAGISGRISDPRLQFVSIAIDAERDTPARLKAYAANFGGDPRWRLLHGPREATWKLVREGLKFAITDDESMPITLPDGSTMLNIRHPAHFVLLGPKGEILGMYLGTRDEGVDALVDRLRRALKKM